MHKQKILIIGEIFVDVHLDLEDKGENIVRLGGIFHAIRACSAINVDYAFAYYAPSYLVQDINQYSLKLNSLGAYQLGLIDKSPNVMLIHSSDESGYQGYNNILSKQAEYKTINDIDDIINKVNPSDIVLFPGRYNAKKILEVLKTYGGKIHIDLNYDSESIFDGLNISVTTAILSTSYIDLFQKKDYVNLIDMFRNKHVDKVIIKENKGGAWCYNFNDNKISQAPAYLEKVMHSVGVGDVYDIIFTLNIFTDNISAKMRFAALCSVAYARTMDFDIFKENVDILVKESDNFISLTGVRVPWFERRNINIYIAAPDFQDVNVEKLNLLVDSLNYHNFMTRLPIRENGLYSDGMPINEELELYYKDIELLNECNILIGVLLYSDQGTLTEIGMFYEMGKPVIIYDPYRLVNNMFLRNSCQYYCNTISDTVNAVFLCSNKKGD